MRTIQMPPLTVRFAATNGGDVTLCTGSVCCTAVFPSATPKEITIMHIDNHGNFNLPQSKVNLQDNPTVTESKLDCGMMFRFAAPGQTLADPTGLLKNSKKIALSTANVLSAEQQMNINQAEQILQHVVTEFVSLQNMLNTLCTGCEFTQSAHTMEDNQQFTTKFSLTQVTKESMSMCKEALTNVNEHVKKLEATHGIKLLAAENLVQIAMQGKASRIQQITEMTGVLFGQSQGPVDWGLRATRAAPGLEMDMHISDKIREGGMKANTGAYMQTLALNLGGMLANITQRFNGDLSSEMSTTNALQLWRQASSNEQIQQEYANSVERGTVCSNTYLPDPQWGVTSGKIQISLNEVGEDQEILGGKAVETLVTSANMGATQIFGDCEDTAAQNAAQLSLMQMPRTELNTRLHAALKNIPNHFSKSEARTDYTLLASHITSLAMTIHEAYACTNTSIKTVDTHEQMLACLQEKLKHTSATNVNVTTAALVASAPKLECNLESSAQLPNTIGNIETYTNNWQAKMKADNAVAPGWMGHSTCAEVTTIPICQYKNVVLSAVQNINILEGTSCAYKLQGENKPVQMNFLTQRKNLMRQNVQNALDKSDRPLSTVMALNIGATVLASELRIALHESGNMQNVNPSQVYKLNGNTSAKCLDGTFYRCMVTAGKLECATLDLQTSQLFPGIALDVPQFPKTVNLAFEACMTPTESEACVLLGHLMSLGRCSDGQAAINAAPLAPLQVRRNLVTENRTHEVTLQAQSACDMHAESRNVMGCVLKTTASADASTNSLKNSAQAVAATARTVYGANTTLSFSAFTNAMILTVPA